MDVKVDGAVWSGGKDAAVVRWDERSRRPATKLKGQSVIAGRASKADSQHSSGNHCLFYRSLRVNETIS